VAGRSTRCWGSSTGRTDLDVWVEAASTEALIVALVESGVDRYEPRDVDRHDVALLCDRFGLDRPLQFR